MNLPPFLKSCLFLTVLLMLSQPMSARHIVGGEVTYVCLGDDLYEFTLLIYRDCYSGGALFDSDFSNGGNPATGTVSIFRGTTDIGTVILDPPLISPIPPNITNPCLVIPDEVCVEQGRYVFTERLDQSPESYTITYSRCCRNNTINNIFFPESTGATYTIELTPFAQETCNNSPVYNNFPEIIICIGEDINFDHSATDEEGDQLVYSFCSPFEGGGTAGTDGSGGSASDLNGVAPNPDAPPPYIDVRYRAPQYTAQFPLGGEPRVTIDPITGLITGIPLIGGQFVVGVCVEEYRNGVLLSTVRRDFQFNVTDCDPTVRADIVEDVLIGNQAFLINICGQGEFQFENQSVEEVNIEEFYWEFDFGAGGIQRFDEWEPLVSFPDTGVFSGVLILNPGQLCGDTAEIFVNVFPEIVADFVVDYDTCIVGPVEFTDFSFTGAEDILDWDWDFGDGGTSTEMSPNHLYETPGIKQVFLTVTDNNDCANVIEQEFNWSPIPSEIIVNPSSFISCTPGGFVTFNNLTSPIDTNYNITWNFGEGNFSSDISPMHEFTDVGNFSVSVEIISPFGCEISRSFNNWITILQGPEADFTFAPTTLTNYNPLVNFTDQSSLDVVNWQWDFAGYGASRDRNPSFTFRDTGLQEIVLLVTAENGCIDTAFAVIDIIPLDSYHLPNAFTPNNDDKNDEYLGVGTLENISDFNMKIWDRWGELIFETNDQFQGWNGEKFNNGPPLPSGVYVVLVTYESARDGEIQIKQYSTLLR